MSEMNEGIRILIDRMKTNPEDFAPPEFTLLDNYHLPRGSWRNLVEYAAESSVFTSQERATVSAAFNEVTRKNFTAKVLETLAAPLMEEKNESFPGVIGPASKEGYGQALQNNPMYNDYQAAQKQAKYK